jgi:hypothetical protein
MEEACGAPGDLELGGLAGRGASFRTAARRLGRHPKLFGALFAVLLSGGNFALFDPACH